MTGNAVLVFFSLAIPLLVVAGLWLVFVKAGEAGVQAIIPIWNIVVLLRIIGRPWWWVILYPIPLVAIVVAAVMAQDLAKSFGKGVGFGVGLWLLGFIFIPVLGFGSATYQGPATAETWGEGSLF
jgi:hypothetical protein